jgi:uncharacterized Zn-binding protein involved in type VI secretion
MVTGIVPHVGGPIAMGCPTVLIGFMPAARATDMAVCVGPPDLIAKGSMTVMIGNMPAARMGDLTAHGGTIVMGCPTVMIGDMGMGAAGGGTGAGGFALNSLCPAIGGLDSLPLKSRLEAEKAVADEISKANPDLALDLGQMRHDRDMAVLSAATYATKDGSALTLPPGYSAGSPDDYDKLGISPAPDIKVFKSESETGKEHFVVAFRGTETGAGAGTAASDIGTDLLQGMGFQTDAYDLAAEAARQAGNSGESVEFTGHSKGGGQAALASAVAGEQATTFNAAGVHHDTLDDAGVSDEQRQAMQSNIRAYNNERDPLNNSQDNRDKILGGGAGVAIATGHPMLAGFLAGIGLSGGLPQASGQRIVVPAAKGQATGLGPEALGEGHSIDTMIRAMDEQIDQKLKQVCGC